MIFCAFLEVRQSHIVLVYHELLFTSSSHAAGNMSTTAHNTTELLENLFCTAARKGDLYVVKCLVEYGIDVNCRDPIGDYSGCYPALMFAVEHGQVHVVKYLLENKVNVNVNLGYTTPLMRAVDLVGSTSCEIMRYLIEYGADVNARSFEDDGYTALMMAAEAGDTEKVRLLLSHDALDKSMTALDGTTSALTLAVKKGHAEVVELLT